MKLIRFGEVGREKPGALLNDGTHLDVSAFGSDYDEAFKIAIVTGGGKGIGAAIVRASGAEGAIPVIVDRDEEVGKLNCLSELL